jgi:hypothetical protein
MWRFASIRFILLALLLVSSQFALANHSTAHLESELLQCELCMGQADSKSAFVHAEYRPDIIIANSLLLGTFLPGFSFQEISQPYHSRAPPFIA